jgi:hypothetical protein
LFLLSHRLVNGLGRVGRKERREGERNRKEGKGGGRRREERVKGGTKEGSFVPTFRLGQFILHIPLLIEFRPCDVHSMHAYMSVCVCVVGRFLLLPSLHQQSTFYHLQ